MIAEYNFNDRMVMSDGVNQSANIQELLLANIPGACNVHRASNANDRNGVDWWVEHRSGKFLAIDCKVRSKDFGIKNPKNDDLALETWSVIEEKIVGWTAREDKLTDYILWFWMDSGRWCLIPFPLLCNVFLKNSDQWTKEYKVATQKTTGMNSEYHSQCVFVPRRVIWAEIYRNYSGMLMPSN